MKILITGAYCSGKTTLANQLHSRFDDSVLVGEVTREVLTLYGQVDWSVPELRDYIFIKQLIEEKKALALNSNLIIVDAGITSVIAHDAVLLKSQPDRLGLLKYFEHVPYDMVFFCDYSDISIEDDGERFTDNSLRAHLSSLVEQTLLSSGLEHYITLSGSRSERLKIAMKLLAGRL